MTNLNPGWQPLEPKQLLDIFADNNAFMRHYLDQIKYEVLNIERYFGEGDLVCYKSLMWGNVPAVVDYPREFEISCHLIGHPDRCCGWQNINDVHHIRLLEGDLWAQKVD